MHSMRRGCVPFWRLCLHAGVSSFAKSTPAPSYDMSCGEDPFACFGDISRPGSRKAKEEAPRCVKYTGLPLPYLTAACAGTPAMHS